MDSVPSYLFMSVTDTGGGIAPEDQRRLFQRLYRADNPTIKGVGDTGVGLSIAKALVETQGGRIWVESDPGIGSTFGFILPLSYEGEDDLVSSLSISDPFAGIIESVEEDE
jgi:signal transduction histidine kinase